MNPLASFDASRSRTTPSPRSVASCRRSVSAVHPGWWRTEWLDDDGVTLGIVTYRRRLVCPLPRNPWWLALANQVSVLLHRAFGSRACRSSAN